MWYENENGDLVKPEALDQTSSKKYIYIRKAFEQVPADGEERPAHWKWLELKIPKDAMAIYQQTADNTDGLDDVYAALTELAELIVGEE